MLIDTDKVNGVVLIAEERGRQVAQHGYTLKGDLETYRNKPGQLNVAAVCYATMAGSNNEMRDMLRNVKPRYWPWDVRWWKPGKDNSHDSRIRELVKAGALLAAEIDRLLGEKHEQAQAASRRSDDDQAQEGSA